MYKIRKFMITIIVSFPALFYCGTKNIDSLNLVFVNFSHFLSDLCLLLKQHNTR